MQKKWVGTPDELILAELQIKPHGYLKEWPIILLCLLIFVETIFIVANALNAKFERHRLRKWDAPILLGMQTKTEKPQWFFKTMMTGEWQKNYDKWFNISLPLRARFVRTHNQLYYSIFSKSYMYSDNILIGKNDYLYEKPYINKYYNLTHADYTKNNFIAWAKQLKCLNDYFVSRGQTFVYLITPSKAAIFPEFLPQIPVAKQKRPDYFLALSVLKELNIPYVDGSAVFLNAKPKFGQALFSRGGTHWTTLGATLVATRLIDKINQLSAYSLPQINFTYHINNEPSGMDVDLLNLSNLLYPDYHFNVPSIEIFPSAKKQQTIKIAFVGGSFVYHLANVLLQSKLFSQLDYHYYFSLNHFKVNTNQEEFPKLDAIPASETNAQAYEDLRLANIVVLEENEINFNSEHFKQFYQLILGSDKIK